MNVRRHCLRILNCPVCGDNQGGRRCNTSLDALHLLANLQGKCALVSTERADKNVGGDVHDVVLYPLEEALQTHPSQEMQNKKKKMQPTCFSQPTSLSACGSHEPTCSRHQVVQIIDSFSARCLLSACRSNNLATFAAAWSSTLHL